MPGILVCATLKGGSLTGPTREALGLARRIAGQRGDRVAAALVGDGVCSLSPELIAGGADVVYVSEHKRLAEYQPKFYLQALQAIAEKVQPGLVVFPGDATGLDLAPRLAQRMGAGLVTDCIGLEIQDGGLVFNKPVYGGKALARLKVVTPVAVVTVRPRTQEVFPPAAGRTGECVTVVAPIDADLADTTLIERVEEEGEEVNLEDARVVVSGGRGMGGAEPFNKLKELAKIMGGAVGASRAAVDAGWAPPSTQVGQTGKIVAPALYFAVALSGSSQHLAGMGGSKIIVAINKDPEAPIMRTANVGIVDDYRNVVPALIEELKKVLSK